MFRRKVKIADVGTGGIALMVTFNILPTFWPSLTKVPCLSWERSQENELKVYSFRFKLVSEAEKWIHKLTDEVIKLVELERELTDKFRRLEGEQII